MHIYGMEDGTELVKAARHSIELYLTMRHFDSSISWF